jgi:diacylglycerol kinase family enzyme
MVWQVLAVVAVVIAVAAMSLAIAATRRLGERDPVAVHPFVRRVLFVNEIPADIAGSFTKDRPGRERLAFIANPTKPGVAQLRELSYRVCAARHLPEPIWLYTAPNYTGRDLAREAVTAGANVLIAAGGDGTVRAVASVAIEACVPLGVIPLGTGNLFARNLGIPINDSEAALRTVLEGVSDAVDVGRMTVVRESGEEREFLFLVLAGVGIDAEMVAGADERLKRQFGWLAYFWALIRHTTSTRMRASVTVGGLEPVVGKMRTVLVANCGRLPGGLVLVPDARVNDGALDIATLDARGGVAGWADLAGQVVLQGTKASPLTLPEAWRVGRIDHARGASVDIVMEAPQRVQADGESLGRAIIVRAVVDAGCLTVRTPGLP